MRTLRPARGVPAPRYDGSAAPLESPLKFAPPATCTLNTTPDQSAEGSDAGEWNFHAEVEELVRKEERVFLLHYSFLQRTFVRCSRLKLLLRSSVLHHGLL
jgi:hypothetical protein